MEAAYAQGNVITPFYDPMIGKLIARGKTRTEALARLRRAVDETVVEGVKTNIDFIRQVLDSPESRSR